MSLVVTENKKMYCLIIFFIKKVIRKFTECRPSQTIVRVMIMAWVLNYPCDSIFNIIKKSITKL